MQVEESEDLLDFKHGTANSKSIRCNRSKPICGKCESLGINCTYIPRRTGPRRNRKLEGILQEIFQRLDRLEGLIVTGPAQPSQAIEQLNTPMPTPPLSVDHRLDFVLELVTEMSNDVRDKLAKIPYQKTHEEIRALSFTLPQTVCDLQEQLLVRRHSWRMTSWNVPNEKANKWVDYWFERIGMQDQILYQKREFMVSMADLLENPHVRIDFATQIVYYNLLFMGMVVHEDRDVEHGFYGRQIYCQILSLIPEWEREESGTSMDFIASFFTMSITLTFSQPDLGHKMLSHACKIGRGLGLFEIDKPDESQIHETQEKLPETEKDGMRTAFWFLLRFDCIFRLAYKKPALIRQGCWTVKIPNVDTVNDTGSDPGRFILCVKTTLVIMRFLELFDHEVPPDIGPRVCSLVDDIISVAETWKLEKDTMIASDVVDRYLYLDHLFGFYSSIILLCTYRPELLQIPELNERLMKTARESSDLLIQMTKSSLESSWQTSIRSVWNSIAYLAIYRAILEAPDLAKSASDLESMLWLESMLDAWSEEYEEIVALRETIKGLNRISQLIVESSRLSASMSPPEMAPDQRGPPTPSQSLPPIHLVEQTGFGFYPQPQP
ncbi:hypothetical protein BKA65DRAFT_219360 [Rhexocercosporidium sp. MPI-PUGE-AT-0058]|nr:hypothetical protein BKA65DRAFT_219360 [Rhexocercosporidium sp. MPI-PUGE-AT-0058]